METRKTAFAGSWYPDTPEGCEREISMFTKSSGNTEVNVKKPVGGIVPHAGWFFSGKIACHVIHTLSKGYKPDVIVMFGMHLHTTASPCITKEGAFETPFGDLLIDSEFADIIADKFDFKVETTQKYTQDNTIELQLPFIKYFFKDTKILPMGVPPTALAIEIGQTAAKIAGQLGRKVKVIGSTDLTHYGYNYGFVSHGSGESAVEWVKKENDKSVINAIEIMDPELVINEGLSKKNACCAGAAAAAISAGKVLGAAKAEMLSYSTSYDKRPNDSFVGYAGIIF
ncbi:MAG: AmmeMemoRadiSam system protein B [Desulfobacterales bacterium]|nr:AmmeMemoRadiSam system protein B [Desulfobacterales bacterium]